MKHYYIDPQTLLGGIVFTDQKQEIVHLSLLEGNTVPVYRADMTIDLFVIEGKVELSLEAAQAGRVMESRELAVLEPNTAHCMKALKDSQLLIIKIKK